MNLWVRDAKIEAMIVGIKLGVGLAAEKFKMS